MGKIMQQRVSGATIVETIVAMVIILVLFGITTTIFVQTSLHSLSVKKIRAAQLANEFYITMIDEKNFDNEEVTKDDFLIKKNIEVYSKNSNVLAITITVLDNNDKEIETQKRLIRLK
jgi:type II secretory pathway pseudopilin PulG